MLILAKILPITLLQKTRWLPFHLRMTDFNESLYSLMDARRRTPVAARGGRGEEPRGPHRELALA